MEDSDVYAYLFKKALREADLSPHLFRMTDGQGAIAILLREGDYSEAPRPDLVLLDLNLSVRSDFDALAVIKSNPSLHEITVVVFSASTYDRERSIALSIDMSLRVYIQAVAESILLRDIALSLIKSAVCSRALGN